MHNASRASPLRVLFGCVSASFLSLRAGDIFVTILIYQFYSSNVSSLSRSSATPSTGAAYSAGSVVAATGPSPALPYSTSLSSSAMALPPSTTTVAAISSSSLSYPKTSAPVWPRFISFHSILM